VLNHAVGQLGGVSRLLTNLPISTVFPQGKRAKKFLLALAILILFSINLTHGQQFAASIQSLQSFL
jgi:hypothetical protein